MAGEADSRCYRNKDFFEVANLNKKHFWVVGSSLGVPWFIFGSSSVFNPRGIGKVQGKENLNKSTFFGKVPEYHSGAINKEKHLQGRCCDQWAQKCLGSRDMLKHVNGVSGQYFVLCITLNPQSGDSSGAILGVPFKALLHLPNA